MGEEIKQKKFRVSFGFNFENSYIPKYEKKFAFDNAFTIDELVEFSHKRILNRVLELVKDEREKEFLFNNYGKVIDTWRELFRNKDVSATKKGEFKTFYPALEFSSNYEYVHIDLDDVNITEQDIMNRFKEYPELDLRPCVIGKSLSGKGFYLLFHLNNEDNISISETMFWKIYTFFYVNVYCALGIEPDYLPSITQRRIIKGFPEFYENFSSLNLKDYYFQKIVNISLPKNKMFVMNNKLHRVDKNNNIVLMGAEESVDVSIKQYLTEDTTPTKINTEPVTFKGIEEFIEDSLIHYIKK